MTASGHLTGIAFDLYERYILLEQIGGLFRPPSSTYRILDVGGHTPALWPGFPSLTGALIPGASVAVVDVMTAAELQNYVRASGVRLPFRDGAFDLVCSLDTLEHIPAEQRAAFLGELLRVTRDGLYLAFPFDSASNRWAESIVVEFCNVVLKDPVPALLEHRQFGLPDREFVAQVFAQSTYPWLTFGQANTDVWLLMMLTYHSLRKPGTDFVHELNRRFNQVYAAQDWAEPNYRAGYVLSKRQSLADLQAVHAAFRSSGKRADLQGVLAFCQLFLTIAQNGRVTCDKDRHIQNLEQGLHDVQSYREKWREVAPILRNLESHLLGIPPSLGPEEPADWPPERLALLAETAGEARAGGAIKLSRMAAQLETMERLSRESETANEVRVREINDRLSGMAAQLERIAERIDGRRSVEFQTRLDSRMRDLEIGLVTNKRAVQAIYDSRIWKALCGLGALLLRLSGGRAGQAPWHSPGPGAGMENITPTADGAPDDFLALVCDYPSEHQMLPVRDVVEIRGWVLAKSGVDRVMIRINDNPPAAASYGIPRLDVARSHPDFIEAGHSGFRFFWDTAGQPEGPCSVHITAVARNGQTREIVCKVRVDWMTPPDYGLWIARHEPDRQAILGMSAHTGDLAQRPLISIAVPVYRTAISLLTRCIESVIGQSYSNWELCLADDGSNDPELAALLRKRAEADSRIRMATLPQNRGIAAATNAALRLSTGDYVAFLDHDDEIAPFALSEIVQAINDHPDTELYYSDEDKIDEQGRRYDAFFKPDWSPDLFRSCNYVCHFVVMKRSLLERLGGLNESYSGSQDYEFLLRASEQTQKIKRIPKILYHWRAVPGSTARASSEKPGASADGERALVSYLERTAPGAKVEEVGACRYRVRYPITGEPRVSILIPTGGHKNVFRALDDVLEKTAYRNYDILLIDNSRSPRVEEYAARLAARQAPVQYVDWRGEPFNFSRMNNAAARMTASPYLLFLNDDTSIVTRDWLTAMLEHAQRPEVGAVGAQLWYPNNLIQHAGVVMGIYGNCSHAFKGLPGGVPHYFDFPNLIRNCSAVTGACLLVGRDKFFEARAFDESNLAVAFQDVDLCLKLLELGYRNVYTPYARLYHYESATKTEKDKIPDPAEDAFMKNKWARYIADDPYYNPNLTLRKEDFSLAID